MKVAGLFKVAERYVVDNAPTLLTAFAVTGTLTTAYLTGKATFKAAEIIQEEQDARSLMETSEPLESVKDKAKLVWKCYIPAGVSVASTICFMVAANSISSSRLAALAAAYAVSDKNFTEYKDKVREMFGEKKSNEVRTAVAQDTVNANPPTSHNVIDAHGGNTLCLDKWTGRYFKSDMQTIRAIENDFAKGLYKGSEVVTLDDFYEALGLPIPKCADSFGWNQDTGIDLTFDSVIHEGEPILVMDFATAPFPVGSYFGHP